MFEKLRFRNKRFLFLKTLYRVSINILDYPPRRITGSLFRNSHGSASEMNYWTTLQGNSSENLPLKFLSQPFFHFSFLSCHALTPNFIGCPSAYEMHYAISVRPEKFQFLEKGQNRNFDYEIIISVKNM